MRALDKYFFEPKERPWEKSIDSLNDFIELIKDSASGLCFGIIGDWGRGKTTYLKYIKNKLKDEKPGCEIIWFDAWLYERSENLEIPLLNMITTKIGIPKNEKWRIALSFFVSLGMQIGKIATQIDFGTVFDNYKKAFNDTYLNNDIHKQIKDEIENQVKEYLTKKSRTKFIIVIDDLDRCNPEKAIELIDSIKNFFVFSNMNFLIGINQNMINQGLRKKYGTLDIVSSNTYLQKILTYSIVVSEPSYDEVKQLFQNISTKLDIQVEEQDIFDILDYLYNVIHFRNPRNLVKIFPLFLHYYEKISKLLHTDNRWKSNWEKISIKHILLIKIIIIREFTPTFYEFLLRHNPEAFFDTWKFAIDKNGDISQYKRRFGINICDFLNDELVILIFRSDVYRLRNSYVKIYESDIHRSFMSEYSEVIRDFIYLVSQY